MSEDSIKNNPKVLFLNDLKIIYFLNNKIHLRENSEIKEKQKEGGKCTYNVF